MEKVNILHLSDIHYYVNSENNNLNEITPGLVEAIKSVTKNPDKKVNVLIVSGDFTFNAEKKSYDNLFSNFCEFLNNNDIFAEDSRLIVCPGNHDFENDKILDYVKNINKECKSDKLTYEELCKNLLKEKKFFENYIEFIIKLKNELNKNNYNIKLPDYEKNYSYLYGKVVLEQYKIRFYILNSAWASIQNRKIVKIIGDNECTKIKKSLEIIHTTDKRQVIGKECVILMVLLI
jgi:predicted phosphodiesterase